MELVKALLWSGRADVLACMLSRRKKRNVIGTDKMPNYTKEHVPAYLCFSNETLGHGNYII